MSCTHYKYTEESAREALRGLKRRGAAGPNAARFCFDCGYWRLYWKRGSR